MVTTILDLLGSLLLVAGLAVWLGALLGLAAGLVAAGVGLLVLSWIIDRPKKARKHKEDRS